MSVDIRAAWNAVERLALHDVALATELAALLREPTVLAALRTLAEAQGTWGGVMRAEQHAHRALHEVLP